MISIPLKGFYVDDETSMSLPDLLETYLEQHEASPRYQESLRRTVRRLSAYGIGGVSQLSPDRVNRFLVAVPVGQTTKHNYRRETFTLWRFAFQQGFTDVDPSRLRRIPPARFPVKAWSREAVQKMLLAAEADETPISTRVGYKRRDFLPAWILIAFDSGLRFSDVLELRHSDIRNACVSVVARKTGKPTIRKLSDAAINAVKRLPKSPDGTLFKWALPRRRALKMWRAFLDQHGFEGSSKWLRRTGATAVEMVRAGSATLFLGHSAPHLARMHYLDQSQFGMPEGPPALR
jgi:integrase